MKGRSNSTKVDNYDLFSVGIISNNSISKQYEAY